MPDRNNKIIIRSIAEITLPDILPARVILINKYIVWYGSESNSYQFRLNTDQKGKSSLPFISGVGSEFVFGAF